jgi:hypothetical protein
VVATRLQVRLRASRTTRLLAAIVGLWFVVGGVLGDAHEAHVAHVIDRASGLAVHGEHVCDHNDSAARTHIHGRPGGHDDDGACEITAALHQAASAQIPSAAISLLPAIAAAAPAPLPVVTISSHSVYRLAPKTSPPRA